MLSAGMTDSKPASLLDAGKGRVQQKSLERMPSPPLFHKYMCGPPPSLFLSFFV